MEISKVYSGSLSHDVHSYTHWLRPYNLTLHLDFELRVTTHEQILQGAKSLTSLLHKLILSVVTHTSKLIGKFKDDV
jgi:hypothetical protein